MDKEFIILMLMARYSMTYADSKILTSSVDKKGKLDEFYEFLTQFPDYNEIIEKYGGKK